MTLLEKEDFRAFEELMMGITMPMKSRVEIAKI